MSAIGDAISEVGRRLTLTPGPSGATVYGELDGRLVQISVSIGEATAVVRVRVDDVEDKTALLSAVVGSQVLADADIGKGSVTLTHDFITHIHAKPVFKAVGPDALEASTRALVSAVNAAAGRRTPGCRMCKGTGSKPVLVGEDVDRLCDACVQKLDFEAENAQRVYDAIPINVPMALIFGLVAAVVGAAAWGGVCILTDRIFWIVGAGVGILIGWGTLRGAGRGGLPVQVIAAVLSLVAVLAGQLIYIGHGYSQYAEQRGESVDWGVFLSNAPAVLMEDGKSTLFTLIAGLAGAWVALKGAGRQQFKVDVHKGTAP